MLDYNKRIDATKERVTVEELIKYLKTLNKDAKISVLGDPQFYIHVEQDGSEVIFDDSPLEDEYPMSYSMSDYLKRNKSEEKSKKEEREERKKELNRAYGRAVMGWEDENDMEEMANLFVEYINAPNDKKVLYTDKIKELYMKVNRMSKKKADKLMLRILEKDEEETIAKKAKEKYEENIKAQTEIPVDENKQEIQSAGPYMEAYLEHLHFTKKGPDDLKEMLTGKINLDTFKEAYVGIGDCRNLFEAKMYKHLNRIVAITSPELLCIALVVKHRGQLKVIPQCPNNKPPYLQEDKVLSINGINFLVNNTIHSMSPDRFVIIDIFKLSKLAKMVIPDAIEYLMKRKEYDAKNDEEANRVKSAYSLIITNSKGKYGPLAPLALPVKN